MRRSEITVKPDYLKRYFDQTSEALANIGEKFYSSKTPNPTLLLLIWLRLDQNLVKTDIVFTTIIENISSWGALWGIMFTVFAFYFLKYNQKNFYKTNPEWKNFNKEIVGKKKELENERKSIMAIKSGKKPFWSRNSSRRESQRVKESREEFLRVDIAPSNNQDGNNQNDPNAIKIEMRNGSPTDERAAAQGENAALIDLTGRPVNNISNAVVREEGNPQKQNCQIF